MGGIDIGAGRDMINVTDVLSLPSDPALNVKEERMFATSADCELDVDRGPDWLLVRVRSLQADSACAPALADTLWSLAEQHFTYRLVLELDRIKVLNSHLIGQLIQLYKRIREHDGVLRLCGLSPYNRRVLRACALDDRFPAYENREEAVMGGTNPRLPR
jgi:anti-anti-sigma factor